MLKYNAQGSGPRSNPDALTQNFQNQELFLEENWV